MVTVARRRMGIASFRGRTLASYTPGEVLRQSGRAPGPAERCAARWRTTPGWRTVPVPLRRLVPGRGRGGAETGRKAAEGGAHENEDTAPDVRAASRSEVLS